MGNLFGQTFKNQALTVTFESGFRNEMKKIQVYSKDHISQEYELPAYNLKQKINLDVASMKGQAHFKPEYLTLLTYNVWFEAHNSQNRYNCILRMLAKSDADIICLQEVNGEFINLLYSSAKQITEKFGYYVPIMKMHWYDTLILSKYPCKFYKKLFENSSMGRCNLVAVIQFAQKDSESTFKVGVNCVHLQSLNASAQRIEQIQLIQSMNVEMDMFIIAGDFNFSDGFQESKAIHQYVDVWATGKKTWSKWATEEQMQTGYTMPPTSRFPSWRPDHIIYKNKSKLACKPNANEIAIIGDFTIPPLEGDHFSKIASDGDVRTPSDHFGLFSKIYF